MISQSRRIIVANETVVFQGTNKMPSVENAEKHEKHLAFLQKNKDAINEARVRAVDRAVALMKERIAENKPINLSQMWIVKKAVGFSIGTKRAVDVCVLATKALMVPPKRTRQNYLSICQWRREKAAIERLMMGAMAEAKKQEGDAE